jgi:hypothetical protein
MTSMDLIPIGQAADRLGLSPSALRHYDERGLVSPFSRHAGRRMYGPEVLRRLAFIKIAQRANSHGAVVAREYGIPAVVGVPDATLRIATGQQITVAGATGLVELH